MDIMLVSQLTRLGLTSADILLWRREGKREERREEGREERREEGREETREERREEAREEEKGSRE